MEGLCHDLEVDLRSICVEAKKKFSLIKDSTERAILSLRSFLDEHLNGNNYVLFPSGDILCVVGGCCESKNQKLITMGLATMQRLVQTRLKVLPHNMYALIAHMLLDAASICKEQAFEHGCLKVLQTSLLLCPESILINNETIIEPLFRVFSALLLSPFVPVSHTASAGLRQLTDALFDGCGKFLASQYKQPLASSPSTVNPPNDDSILVTIPEEHKQLLDSIGPYLYCTRMSPDVHFPSKEDATQFVVEAEDFTPSTTLTKGSILSNRTSNPVNYGGRKHDNHELPKCHPSVIAAALVLQEISVATLSLCAPIAFQNPSGASLMENTSSWVPQQQQSSNLFFTNTKNSNKLDTDNNSSTFNDELQDNNKNNNSQQPVSNSDTATEQPPHVLSTPPILNNTNIEDDNYVLPQQVTFNIHSDSLPTSLSNKRLVIPENPTVFLCSFAHGVTLPLRTAALVLLDVISNHAPIMLLDPHLKLILRRFALPAMFAIVASALDALSMVRALSVTTGLIRTIVEVNSNLISHPPTASIASCQILCLKEEVSAIETLVRRLLERLDPPSYYMMDNVNASTANSNAASAPDNTLRSMNTNQGSSSVQWSAAIALEHLTDLFASCASANSLAGLFFAFDADSNGDDYFSSNNKDEEIVLDSNSSLQKNDNVTQNLNLHFRKTSVAGFIRPHSSSAATHAMSNFEIQNEGDGVASLPENPSTCLASPVPPLMCKSLDALGRILHCLTFYISEEDTVLTDKGSSASISANGSASSAEAAASYYLGKDSWGSIGPPLWMVDGLNEPEADARLAAMKVAEGLKQKKDLEQHSMLSTASTQLQLQQRHSNNQLNISAGHTQQQQQQQQSMGNNPSSTNNSDGGFFAGVLSFFSSSSPNTFPPPAPLPALSSPPPPARQPRVPLAIAPFISRLSNFPPNQVFIPPAVLSLTATEGLLRPVSFIYQLVCCFLPSLAPPPDAPASTCPTRRAVLIDLNATAGESQFKSATALRRLVSHAWPSLLSPLILSLSATEDPVLAKRCADALHALLAACSCLQIPLAREAIANALCRFALPSVPGQGPHARLDLAATSNMDGGASPVPSSVAVSAANRAVASGRPVRILDAKTLICMRTFVSICRTLPLVLNETWEPAIEVLRSLFALKNGFIHPVIISSTIKVGSYLLSSSHSASPTAGLLQVGASSSPERPFKHISTVNLGGEKDLITPQQQSVTLAAELEMLTESASHLLENIIQCLDFESLVHLSKALVSLEGNLVTRARTSSKSNSSVHMMNNANGINCGGSIIFPSPLPHSAASNMNSRTVSSNPSSLILNSSSTSAVPRSEIEVGVFGLQIFVDYILFRSDIASMFALWMSVEDHIIQQALIGAKEGNTQQGFSLSDNNSSNNNSSFSTYHSGLNFSFLSEAVVKTVCAGFEHSLTKMPSSSSASSTESALTADSSACSAAGLQRLFLLTFKRFLNSPSPLLRTLTASLLLDQLRNLSEATSLPPTSWTLLVETIAEAVSIELGAIRDSVVEATCQEVDVAALACLPSSCNAETLHLFPPHVSIPLVRPPPGACNTSPESLASLARALDLVVGDFSSSLPLSCLVSLLESCAALAHSTALGSNGSYKAVGLMTSLLSLVNRRRSKLLKDEAEQQRETISSTSEFKKEDRDNHSLIEGSSEERQETLRILSDTLIQCVTQLRLLSLDTRPDVRHCALRALLGAVQSLSPEAQGIALSGTIVSIHARAVQLSYSMTPQFESSFREQVDSHSRLKDSHQQHSAENTTSIPESSPFDSKAAQEWSETLSVILETSCRVLVIHITSTANAGNNNDEGADKKSDQTSGTNISALHGLHEEIVVCSWVLLQTVHSRLISSDYFPPEVSATCLRIVGIFLRTFNNPMGSPVVFQLPPHIANSSQTQPGSHLLFDPSATCWKILSDFTARISSSRCPPLPDRILDAIPPFVAVVSEIGSTSYTDLLNAAGVVHCSPLTSTHHAPGATRVPQNDSIDDLAPTSVPSTVPNPPSSSANSVALSTSQMLLLAQFILSVLFLPSFAKNAAPLTLSLETPALIARHPPLLPVASMTHASDAELVQKALIQAVPAFAVNASGTLSARSSTTSITASASTSSPLHSTSTFLSLFQQLFPLPLLFTPPSSSHAAKPPIMSRLLVDAVSPPPTLPLPSFLRTSEDLPVSPVMSPPISSCYSAPLITSMPPAVSVLVTPWILPFALPAQSSCRLSYPQAPLLASLLRLIELSPPNMASAELLMQLIPLLLAAPAVHLDSASICYALSFLNCATRWAKRAALLAYPSPASTEQANAAGVSPSESALALLTTTPSLALAVSLLVSHRSHPLLCPLGLWLPALYSLCELVSAVGLVLAPPPQSASVLSLPDATTSRAVEILVTCACNLLSTPWSLINGLSEIENSHLGLLAGPLESRLSSSLISRFIMQPVRLAPNKEPSIISIMQCLDAMLLSPNPSVCASAFRSLFAVASIIKDDFVARIVARTLISRTSFILKAFVKDDLASGKRNLDHMRIQNVLDLVHLLRNVKVAPKVAEAAVDIMTQQTITTTPPDGTSALSTNALNQNHYFRDALKYGADGRTLAFLLLKEVGACSNCKIPEVREAVVEVINWIAGVYM